ncbi:thymine dioxygenase [Xylona heveae TC161]|uniref:Thymine dioxygenase n=1 Tax=Xylona heveae (strain CBS 132557 / TC161) TaxID=1328760 RepID=A0A165JVG6_XYLHT|nr:thymine dioxygenase [Xylona heveae TC161]KZF26682.1 thymine dioxygenase [Xylona heveae TC161]
MAPGLVDAAVAEDNLVIPLVDFSRFLHGTNAEKQSTARAIADGFRTAGFIYIKNHGIPPETVARAFSESADFFNRPREQKEELAWSGPQSNRGYIAQGREKVTQLVDEEEVKKLRAQVPDLKESLEIGREGEEGRPNHWPDHFDEHGKVFKDIMIDFFDLCNELHRQIMRAIALGMGIDLSYFDEYTGDKSNTLRLLHYPAVEKEIFLKNKAQVRAGEHSDYGSITLLFQDMRGGLQVKSPNGNFVNATPLPGTIVINAGDLLERWSNDSIKSTKHRVIEPPTPPEAGEYPARYSIAYFCNPGASKYIEAIPGTFEKEGKKYPGVYAGEYLAQRLAATLSY